MADMMEIITGISQVMANTHDGAVNEKGEPLKIGLKREAELPFTDKRVMDGFKVKISGNKLRVNYTCDVKTSDVHEKGFEDDIHQTIADVVKFLKKEFKIVTKKALSLKEIGEPTIEIINTSKVRNWVEASCTYEIGKLDSPDDEEDKEKKSFETAIKDWISQGRKENSKTPNDDR